ncbi:uncharacterized protein LOC119681324 [Teleopsis dalmanni]|uniref:uncharacterized protein LOC119681324 n=1 Tax=Teleopsis dalmanni TaxID=139649 RepID=UPI0018CCCAAD|nr:uncharacterized protein LOC119681324 [Teleopsis dalmanni]XP_037950412.1 uncharacterized protein LOC119681324 [Teleopsis dalmanni]
MLYLTLRICNPLTMQFPHTRQFLRGYRLIAFVVVVVVALQNVGVKAKIASATDISGGVGAASLNNVGHNRCSERKFVAHANKIDDVEDLELDVPVSIAFENGLKKRFVLFLNSSTPLTINFSQNVARKLYFNETTNLSRALKPDQRTLLLHCALRGQYDLFILAKHSGAIKIEAHAAHPQSNWPLLNRTNRVSIRTQNRVRKRQMIVKWNKSKFDFYAMHYCLVISTRQPHKHFCNAVNEHIKSEARNKATCFPGSVMDYIWLRPPERVRAIDSSDTYITNIICTGNRTQQTIRAVVPNRIYFLDLFGVHTKQQNLTFHIAATKVHFTRTHPTTLRSNLLSMEKINGAHGVQVFSFKIPRRSPFSYRQSAKQHLRYLIVPCGGSEINAKIKTNGTEVGNVQSIYQPTYIKVPEVHPDQRYVIRFSPSNVDEMLRASKVGLAVTTSDVFTYLPELPHNMTVFEARTRCNSTTIAWYSSPEIRTMSYCIIVFHFPQNNRLPIDHTDYCMDFGKRVKHHRYFYLVTCNEKEKNPPMIESYTIRNLEPGENYLIYVTANLSDGKPLPYQSLKVKMGSNCDDELLDSSESYYENISITENRRATLSELRAKSSIAA